MTIYQKKGDGSYKREDANTFSLAYINLIGGNTMLIYRAINKTNGKSYVGQTIFTLEKRKDKHVWDSLNGCNMYFHRAIRKYDIYNFKWTTLHDNIITIEDLNRLEIFYINYYDTFGNGYNLTEGGGGSIGFKHTEKSKAKMSETHKGKKLSEGHKEKISVANSGENNAFYGKHHSEETRKKMSNSRRGEKHRNYGKHLPIKTRRKISEALSGRFGGQNNRARAVIIKDDQFDTLKEAAEFIGVTPSSIRKRILHKTKWLDYSYVKE